MYSSNSVYTIPLEEGPPLGQGPNEKGNWQTKSCCCAPWNGKKWASLIQVDLHCHQNIGMTHITMSHLRNCMSSTGLVFLQKIIPRITRGDDSLSTFWTILM